jgi:hypothetical protein
MIMNRHLRRSCTSALVAASALGTIAAAQAGPNTNTVYVKAQLSAGQEAPKPRLVVTDATGAFSASFAKTPKGYTMTWNLTYDKLSGKVTSAFIHRGAKGGFGPALFALCEPCNGNNLHGSAYASPSEVALVVGNQTYVNVRTTKNPSGEIRGQLTQSSH